MYSELEFGNKVVLITGSSGGLGARMAKEFATKGAQVVITGRRAEKIEEVAEVCDGLSPVGLTALQVVADVTVDEDLKRLVDTVVETFGQIDVLVNNAGAGVMATIDDPELINKIEHMFRLDVRSVVLLTQLCAAHLVETKGSVIMISSVAAIKPFPNGAPYCMAKASLDMFSKCLALELGPKGVRVNAVNPTAVRTEFQANAGMGDAIVEHMEKTLPLRKIPEPDDIAKAVLFLASDESSFITGISLPVDCGAVIM